MPQDEREMRVLDYAPCRYGASRLDFRGPRRVIDDGEYIAVLGGIETFGQYVERPFPVVMEEKLNMRCVNLGALGAGPDAWLADETILRIAAAARLTVITVPGAHMLSNRFFTVHSRRNDRVVQQPEFMRRVFPELDLSEHYFVRHLLSDLHTASLKRFAMVRDDLQKMWITRMNALTARIPGDIVLLWLGDRAPDDPCDTVFDGDPPLVSGLMMRSLRGRIRRIVEVLDQSDSEETALIGKIHPQGEREAALRVPTPAAHVRAGAALADAIADLLDDGDVGLSEQLRRMAG